MTSDGPVSHDHELAMLERLTFFSDAVFAIAMTLLVVDVRLPAIEVHREAALGQAIADLTPKFIGFLVSFFVVGRFWIGHHRIMGMLQRTNPRLVWINLFFLLAVAFMPFPTAVLSEYANMRVGVGLYTGWLMVLGILNICMNRAALGTPQLVREGISDTTRAAQRHVSLLPLLTGALAFILGLIQPFLAIIALLLGLPIISWLLRRGAPKVSP